MPFPRRNGIPMPFHEADVARESPAPFLFAY